ncbi:hypothetical protein PVAND_005813 [Polypedilum vanderplanki]|uniref:Adenylate kinase n=1 Tax=Polypedilum vanderplanki TaxID=319348 RepID=A0A9J6C1A7_POLVA|nr:hypothetical protein PVAND_005813 [Polypedilum vanderplanki]
MEQIDIKIPIIFVLGGPGSGKGTQCERIVEKYGFTHLSTGNLLREEVASGSTRGQEIQAIMSSGGIVDNETVLDLLQAAILKTVDPKGFLIDGFPREEKQGPAFENRFRPVDLVIVLNCTDEVLINRIVLRSKESANKRSDDNEKTARIRIARYRENIEKISLKYSNKLKYINGDQTKDEVFENIMTVINELIIKKSE